MKILMAVLFILIYGYIYSYVYKLLAKGLGHLISNKDAAYSEQEMIDILNLKFPTFWGWIYDFGVLVTMVFLPFAVILPILANGFFLLSNGILGQYVHLGVIIVMFSAIFFGIALYTMAWSTLAKRNKKIMALVIQKQLEGALASGMDRLKQINIKEEFRSGIILFVLSLSSIIICTILF